MTIRRILAALAVIALAAQGLMGVTAIEEDSPLWNCHTMGNHICGTPQ